MCTVTIRITHSPKPWSANEWTAYGIVGHSCPNANVCIAYMVGSHYINIINLSLSIGIACMVGSHYINIINLSLPIGIFPHIIQKTVLYNLI